MKDKPKQDWHLNVGFWAGTIVYLALLSYASFFSPGNPVVSIFAIATYFAYTIIFLVYGQTNKVKPGVQLACFVLAGIFLLLTVARINDTFFHVYVTYQVTLAILIACLIAVASAFLMIGRARDVSRRQAQQQKQIDQTKLDPIYVETAKHDKVKEQ